MNIVDMSSELLYSELSTIPIFSCIPKEDLKPLTLFSKICSFEKDEILIPEGSASTDFFVLMTRKLDIIKKGKWNEEVQLAVLKDHATVGESALLTNELSTATVRAAETSIVLIISREQFIQYINNYPKAGLVIMTYIVFGLLQKLRETNEELVEEKNLIFSSEDLAMMMSLFHPNLDDMLDTNKENIKKTL